MEKFQYVVALAAVITGLGIGGAVLGGILLCRRDQKNA